MTDGPYHPREPSPLQVAQHLIEHPWDAPRVVLAVQWRLLIEAARRLPR